MNFQFINELNELLKDNNVFTFLIIGGKSLALVLLTFKFLDGVIGRIGDDNQKLNDLPKFVAYAFFIVSSDWIVNLIESSLSLIDFSMSWTENTQYAELDRIIDEAVFDIYEKSGKWWEYIGVFFGNIEFFVFFEIARILSFFCKIADMAMTCSYLLIRLFLIQLMKVIFPLVIALSTLDLTKDLLGKWIKKFIGLFILGLGYIGILNFIGFVQSTLLKQFVLTGSQSIYGHSQLGYLGEGILITIIVTFTLKVKLFQQVTSFISNFFA